jgi:RNA polymerase sigma factor (sigma-70 family)
MPDHDAALLGASRVGTEWPAGLLDLYATNWISMVRLARLLTAADAASEEIVQDAFLRMRAKWDTIDRPPAYLRAAVVNGCRNHQRRRLLERRHPASAQVVADQPEEMRAAVAALPARQRAALVLRYYEDLPEAAIAELMHCSVAAVKSLLHRAVGDLRKVIER